MHALAAPSTVRALTVTAIHLAAPADAYEQVNLFTAAAAPKRKKQEQLEAAMDHIRSKYGADAISYGASGRKKRRKTPAMTRQEEKQQLRAVMRARERQLSDRYRRESDQAIAAHLTAMPEYQAAGTIFCFVGTPHEIDTRPILENALAAGKTAVCPLHQAGHDGTAADHRPFPTLPGCVRIPEPPEDAPLCPWMRQILPSSPASPATIWATVWGRVGDITTVFGSLPQRCCAALPGKTHSGGDPLEPHDYPIPWVLTEQGLYEDGIPARLE